LEFELSDELTTQFVKHINSVIDWYRKEANNEENKWINDAAGFGIIARAKTIIEQVAGKNSAYYEQMQIILKQEWLEPYKAQMLIGVLTALRGDLLDGYLASVTQLIHGAVFNDFLDMARHLLEEGYKDAAAVIAGGVLEAHLRQLCIKNGLAIEQTTSGKAPRPKRASQLNQELGNNIYSLFDQQNVTAWLALRNNAAHGKFSEYSGSQVSLFIEGIQDFISRNPA
jgi:hypothetical protein